MNDTPPDQPTDDNNENVNKEAAGPESPAAAKKAPETPPGMLPLVDPFFGNRAFVIAALPFIIYFIGTAFGAHVETTRKTQPAHDIRGTCRGMVDLLTEKLDQDLLEEQAQDIKTKLDLPAISDAMDDESSKPEVLYKKCKNLLEGGDFAEYPFDLQDDLGVLRDFAKEFIHIQKLYEDGEHEKIRPSYIDFMKQQDPEWDELKLNDSFYPTLYSIACLSAFVAMLFMLPTYLKKMPFRISPLAIAVGVAGIFLWVGIWWLNNEFGIGTASKRAAFNPFVELSDNPTWMWTFLGIRLLGIALVIPIAEEFFTRGFLMRYCEDIDWDQIPVGEATWRGWAGILAYAAFSHQEIIAALVWFGLVTWMYLKTKNIWDCVVAHAVTNGLLAAFVIYFGHVMGISKVWQLW